MNCEFIRKAIELVDDTDKFNYGIKEAALSELVSIEQQFAAKDWALAGLIETCESEDVQAYGELPDREAIQDAKEAIVNQRRKQL